jgi:hypothetical protein
MFHPSCQTDEEGHAQFKWVDPLSRKRAQALIEAPPSPLAFPASFS